MSDFRQPGAWLDADLTAEETAETAQLIALLPELEAEKDADKVIERVTPYMNSFMHLLYLLIRGKIGLEATDDGVTYKDRPNMAFDIAAFAVDFILKKYGIPDLLTPAELRAMLPQFTSVIPKKHVIPNNKLANSLTQDIIDVGLITLDVGKKKGEIITKCILNYEGDSVKLSSRQPFTEYDRQVADAVTSLYVYGDESRVITPATVYRAMVHATETETPSPQQIGAVTRSLDKMRFVRVQIDCTEELKRRKLAYDGTPITAGKIDTYLLTLRKLEVVAGGQKVTAYKIAESPVLYEYSRITGQVQTVPAALLDIRDAQGAKVANTERRIAIKGYLLRRIAVMAGKTGNKQSRHIMYEAVYSEASNDGKELARKEQQAIREYVGLVLDNWQREGFIKGYTELSQGRKKTGVEINI